MLIVTLFVTFLAICPQLQTNAQNVTIQDALLRSQEAVNTVQLALDAKLPPNAEAQGVGNDIVDSLKRALKICDENLAKDLQIVEHSKCVASNMGMSMAAVGELVGASWAASGASRPGLFFC